MSGLAIETVAQQASASLPQPALEPSTIRRCGVGLRRYDPERAFTGFTLFSPLPSTNKTVYLIEMLGNVVHTWQMPYPHSSTKAGLAGSSRSPPRGSNVWEYVNPYFGPRQQLVVNAVQRVYRYSAADIARGQSAT